MLWRLTRDLISVVSRRELAVCPANAEEGMTFLPANGATGHSFLTGKNGRVHDFAPVNDARRAWVICLGMISLPVDDTRGA